MFATLDDINAIVLVANSKGEIVFANKAIKKILGYEPEEVLGDGWWRLTSRKSVIDERKSITSQLATGKKDINERHLYENLLLTKSGDEVWTQWTNTLTDDGYLVGIAQDITEKKTLQEELTKKYHENELLLKEIHHRVKNNLQIIASLLNLQFNNIEDNQVTEGLAKIKDRINSMALIHTRLYRSGNLTTINFGEYIEELVESIDKSYSPHKEIKYTVSHSEEVFDIDLSINLGLIITELLTNSYKHGFNGRSKGQIKISLSKTAHMHQLIVSDNGVGINDDFEANNSLGLELVNALIDQINGEIETSNVKGLKHTITFHQ